MMENEYITGNSNSYEKVKIFKQLGSLLTSKFYSFGNRLKPGNSCYYVLSPNTFEEFENKNI